MTSPHPGPLWLRFADRPARAMILTGLAAILLVGLSLALNGTATIGWRAATRSTAAFAYGFWLIVFSTSSLVRLFPNATTRALLARRRALGLGFATALFIHGLAILALARLDSDVLVFDVSVLGGGLGFAWVAAMAATSNDAAMARLGRDRWRRLHRAGQILLFGIFAVTYAGRVANDPAFWPGLTLLGVALGLRLAAAIQSARLRSSTLPTE